eukprot:gnl/TRDRNA2_/TRDRNA2_85389_c0_seq1.p1 gnl/TRDRNA2_/TRDRNA2_85389_c0~~gnl/TRDRNA2_/TRDRNA2_85389_c0_seq1.p1  ORF type:complete len:675 (+),score=105.56 gnl/TRDRNA2_/TRDRNA2_85389_c0_seq1:81-2105(+)
MPVRNAQAMRLIVIMAVARLLEAVRDHEMHTSVAAEDVLAAPSGTALLQEEASSQQISSGRVLRGRYELKHFIETRPTPLRHSRAIPEQNFPDHLPREVARTLEPGEHMGIGSFGDAWAAYDRTRETTVVVKVFYRKPKVEFGAKEYLTKRIATEEELDFLEENKEECVLIQHILQFADIYPVGASRICACLEHHIDDAAADDNLFLVQEMCGTNLWDYVQEAKSQPMDLARARHITKQVLQGIGFLNRFTVPLIHHDLKPGNLVMQGSDVKLIDFGGMLRSDDPYVGGPWTPSYAPPELTTDPDIAFALPSWSYDVYAAGCIYLQLLCPYIEVEDLEDLQDPHVQPRQVLQSRCRNVVSHVADDLALIDSLMSTDPQNRMEPVAASEEHVLNKDVRVTNAFDGVWTHNRPGHEAEDYGDEYHTIKGNMIYWSTSQWEGGDGHPSEIKVHADDLSGEAQYGRPGARHKANFELVDHGFSLKWSNGDYWTKYERLPSFKVGESAEWYSANLGGWRPVTVKKLVKNRWGIFKGKYDVEVFLEDGRGHKILAEGAKMRHLNNHGADISADLLSRTSRGATSTPKGFTKGQRVSIWLDNEGRWEDSGKIVDTFVLRKEEIYVVTVSTDSRKHRVKADFLKPLQGQWGGAARTKDVAGGRADVRRGMQRTNYVAGGRGY